MQLIQWLRQSMPFSENYIISGYISFGDVLLATLMSVIIVWAIRKTRSLLTLFSLSPDEFREMQIVRIAERCHMMFPNTSLNFGGKTFTRGMLIRVTTRANTTFEGRFMGRSDDNVICVMTKIQIAADILDNILEIIAIDEENVVEH